MKERGLAILRLVVVVLFMSYYGGAALFTHTHQFEWGSVTHSHPYVPSGHHSHTAAGCQLVDNLSNILFIVSAASLLPLDYASKHIRTARMVECPITVLALCGQSRAPPIY